MIDASGFTGSFRFRQNRSQNGRSKHRPLRKKRQTKQERMRPEAKKKHRCPRPKPPRLVVDNTQFVNETEVRTTVVLKARNIAYVAQKAVTPIALDLKGKGKTWFKPDFYLPDFEVYLEVTASKNPLGIAKKRSKIASAERAGAMVVLIDLETLSRLERETLDIFDLLSPYELHISPMELALTA